MPTRQVATPNAPDKLQIFIGGAAQIDQEQLRVKVPRKLKSLLRCPDTMDLASGELAHPITQYTDASRAGVEDEHPLKMGRQNLYKLCFGAQWCQSAARPTLS